MAQSEATRCEELVKLHRMRQWVEDAISDEKEDSAGGEIVALLTQMIDQLNTRRSVAAGARHRWSDPDATRIQSCENDGCYLKRKLAATGSIPSQRVALWYLRPDGQEDRVDLTRVGPCPQTT